MSSITIFFPSALVFTDHKEYLYRTLALDSSTLLSSLNSNLCYITRCRQSKKSFCPLSQSEARTQQTAIWFPRKFARFLPPKSHLKTTNNSQPCFSLFYGVFLYLGVNCAIISKMLLNTVRITKYPWTYQELDQHPADHQRASDDKGRCTARLYLARQSSLPLGTSPDHSQSYHGWHAASRSENKINR